MGKPRRELASGGVAVVVWIAAWMGIRIFRAGQLYELIACLLGVTAGIAVHSFLRGR